MFFDWESNEISVHSLYNYPYDKIRIHETNIFIHFLPQVAINPENKLLLLINFNLTHYFNEIIWTILS